MTFGAFLVGEYFRILAWYGWSPREADEMTLREMISAWLAIPAQRRERLRDQAITLRVSTNAKQQQFNDFLKRL